MNAPKEISDIHVTQAMKRYGGSFVMHLGQAAQHADTENLEKIKQAFPQIWECYSEMAKTDLIEFVAAELHKANFQSAKTEAKDCGGYYCSEEHGHIDCWVAKSKPKGETYKYPVFTNCNVCGRSLMGDSEFAMGMCTGCANEGVGL